VKSHGPRLFERKRNPGNGASGSDRREMRAAPSGICPKNEISGQAQPVLENQALELKATAIQILETRHGIGVNSIAEQKYRRQG
jgi:hypothetical protein